jgi:hypothetical protein
MNQLDLIDSRNVAHLPSIRQADYVDAAVIATNTPMSHTHPALSKYVMLTPTADTWVMVGAAALVPTADVTNGTGSILVPGGVSRLFELKTSTTIGLDTASATGSVVCMEYFR